MPIKIILNFNLLPELGKRALMLLSQEGGRGGGGMLLRRHTKFV